MKKVVLLIALLSAATPALAQDTGAPATYREIELDSGFSGDPRVIPVRAGGTIDASRLGSPCTGFIAGPPDVRLTYTAGSLPLILSVAAATDTTLVVNAPDGRWYCDDDNGEAPLNPMVRFNDPASGRYEIWIGTFSDTTSQPARLHISELTSQ
ncbi:MAG TPA: hypothetical protein VGO55_09480 [Allosphingosinicella sp.]|jgi:hypothetical protein|nr:hypothetical protein [Allosphingosinicella sp.]